MTQVKVCLKPMIIELSDKYTEGDFPMIDKKNRVYDCKLELDLNHRFIKNSLQNHQLVFLQWM